MRTTKPMLAAASVSAIAIGTSAFAGSSFNTGCISIDLANNLQLQDTFTINYNLMTAYVDLSQNGTVDTTVDTSGEIWATPSYDAFYSDPEHYVLSLGTSDVYFMGNLMNIEGEVAWTLSYTSVAGDASTIYSTILFGTVDRNAGGLGIDILNIRDGIEWPVSGDGATPATRIGFAINDFDSFTFNQNTNNLAANVVPGPFGLMVLAGFGLATRRRNR